MSDPRERCQDAADAALGSHAELIETAKEAISAVFGDTSVSRSETKSSLKDLREHIDIMLDDLRNNQ